MPEIPGERTAERQKPPPQPGQPGWNEWVERFISTLQKERSVTHAYRAAGGCRTTAYERRKQDADFRRRWDQTVEGFLDELEDSALKRATFGYPEPFIHEGKPVFAIDPRTGEEARDEEGNLIPLEKRRFNESLAIFLLKCRRGYRDQSDAETPEEKARFIAELVRAMQDGGSSPPPDNDGGDAGGD